MRNNQSHNKRKTKNQNFWISVSDLLAGIIFLFLILLAVFSIQFKHEQQTFERDRNELQNAGKTRLHILSEIKNYLETEDLKVEILPREGILRLHEHGINFPASEAYPTKNKLANIGKIARALAYILPCYSIDSNGESIKNIKTPKWCGVPENQNHLKCEENSAASKIDTVMIEGHTDPTPVKATAPYPNNLTLSAMRASAVWQLIKTCQPSLANLYNNNAHNIIGVSGYSSFRPAYPEDPKNPKNRRIDIRFVMQQPQIAIGQSVSIKEKEETTFDSNTPLQTY